MKKTRTLLAAAAAIAGLVAFPGPAQAVPPHAVPSDPFVLPGTDDVGNDGFCSFPVRIVQAAIKAPVETPGPDGSTVVTFRGFGYATVTNVDTDKTLKFNISGPGAVTVFADGAFEIDAKGPNLLYTTVANSFPGVPQLAYTTGHVRVSVAASGLTTSYKLNGRSTDVCELLAP